MYVKEFIKGDTVYIEKYKDRWRDRVKVMHDTTVKYQLLRDSVVVEIPVRVEKKLSPVKKMKIGLFFPLILIALVGWRREIIKLIRKFI